MRRSGFSLARKVLAGLGLGVVALSLAGCDPKPVHVDKKIVHEVAVAVTKNKAQARQLEKVVQTATSLYNEWSDREVGEDSGGDIRPIQSHRSHPQIEGNPRVGTSQSAPQLLPGDLKSPVFIANEADYFAQARQLIAQARPGERLALQMYEFENARTNGDHSAARQAPGYADQQALLGELEGAAERGVDIDVVLDGSKDSHTHELMNGPVADALIAAGRKTGHVTLDFYPANVVNIDHAKELVKMVPAGKSVYKVQAALVGGTNWGNHTPANDDGGALFYGRDALGAAQVFYRDQAFSRGELNAPPIVEQSPDAPVQWAVTSPGAEGGGSDGIKQAKLALTAEADAVYLNEFCLNHQELLKASLGREVHARVDPNEFKVNQGAVQQIRAGGGQALWANTSTDSRMPGQKNHEKLDVYVKDGVPFAVTIGSANDSNQGLESGYSTLNSQGKRAYHKTNHEIDAVVRRFTSPDGGYSTAPFLDQALAKTKHDLEAVSLQSPPSRRSAPDQF